jgi:hypothetical protein
MFGHDWFLTLSVVRWARLIEIMNIAPNAGSPTFSSDQLPTYGGDLPVNVYNLGAYRGDHYRRGHHRSPNSNANTHPYSHPNCGTSGNAGIAHGGERASNDRVSRCHE